jgi:hypothetical protein
LTNLTFSAIFVYIFVKIQKKFNTAYRFSLAFKLLTLGLQDVKQTNKTKQNKTKENNQTAG